jgi:hypothetical protein
MIPRRHPGGRWTLARGHVREAALSAQWRYGIQHVITHQDIAV